MKEPSLLFETGRTSIGLVEFLSNGDTLLERTLVLCLSWYPCICLLNNLSFTQSRLAAHPADSNNPRPPRNQMSVRMKQFFPRCFTLIQSHMTAAVRGVRDDELLTLQLQVLHHGVTLQLVQLQPVGPCLRGITCLCPSPTGLASAIQNANSSSSSAQPLISSSQNPQPGPRSR